jgi:putative thioredoxin
MALKDKNDRKVFENLLDAIIRDKPFANELARRACIAMFHRLGEDHPLSKEFRPRFNMALY